EQIYHVALIDRIHQSRGLSIFASVLNRLIDIQDYEDSERIAAKVAASLCAQIVKGDAALYADAASAAVALDAVANAYRSLKMVPGMIGDDLLPGERVEIIDSKRPNPNAADFVDGQLRRTSGGFGTSFSSLSMNYNGTYSAQRQELIEKWGAYAMLGEQFIARVMRPIWNQFVYAATLSGALKVPRGWSVRQLSAAVFVRPQMPWIDPLKEALARGELEDRGWQSPQQSILQTGNDPEEVQRLREDWSVRMQDSPAAPTAGQEPAAGIARRASLRDHALQDKSE
ncbi:MAG: phage portal protein, partial [Dokdonella sp.]